MSVHTSNKMERFTYEGGCDVCILVEAIKEVLGLAMNKYFQLNNNIMKPLSYQRIKPF